MAKPPVRQDWEEGTAREVQEQITAHKKRLAKQRPKGTYDLPSSLLTAVASIAEAESIPKSDVVALALVRFVEDYRAGGVELVKEPAPRSLRHEWKIQLPAKWQK